MSCVQVGADAEVHLVDQQRRVEHEHQAQPDEQDLRAEVSDRQEQVELGRLAEPADVQSSEQRNRDRPPMMSPGLWVRAGKNAPR